MPRIKALVFDLDGTLVDQEGAERDALQQLLDHEIKLAAKPAFHVFLRDWRNIADDYLQRFLNNQMGFDEQRIKRFEALFAKYGEPCTRLEAERLHQAYGRLYSEQWRAFDETAEALLNLKQAGYRLAVITNGDGEAQRGKLKATNLSHWFETVLVSGELKVSKPDVAIFRACEQAMKLQPEELAYVGDRPDADVAGALAAGWLPIWLDRKGMPEAQSTMGPKVLVVQRLTQVQAKLG
jgi:putative hydrolase of the HAD superfamily